MKIRRFEAPSVQEALQKVKQELGPEAVILYTKKVKKGGLMGLFGTDVVEVTAGLDGEVQPQAASSIAGAALPKAMAAIARASQSGPPPPAAPSVMLPPPSATQTPPNPRQRRVEILQSELNDGKVITGAALVRAPQPEKPNQRPDWHPELTRIEKNLVNQGVDETLAHQLLEGVNREIMDKGYPRSGSLAQVVKRHMSDKIKVAGPTEVVRGKTRVIAFIGPTGVGKTTSLVKLASQYALMHQAKVAMITADTYRIGAVEQLKIYRDIIEIPLEAVNTTSELEASLRRFSDKDLIFFDTAGRSPQNKRQIQELRNFLEVSDPAETHLVMSATTKNADLLPIVGKFGLVPINRFLFTKLDETRSYGTFYNMASNFSIPISYLATGQNVPNDIESATAEGVAELVSGEAYGRPGR